MKKTGLKKVSIKICLRKYSSSKKAWNVVKTWSAVQEKRNITVSQNYQLSSKGKYRVKVDGIVYASDGNEKVSAVSSVVNY